MDSIETDRQQQKVSRLTLILVLGVLTALGPLAIDLYLPALPAIAHDLGVPLGTVQFTLSAYTVGFALGQLIYGPLADRYGRMRVLLPGLLGYIVTNMLAAFCETGLQLIVVRVLQAMSAAAIMVTIPVMVKDLFSQKECAKMMSSVLMVMTLAPLVAPLLGGQILRFFGWESLFVFLALAAVVATVLTFFTLSETLAESNRLRVPASQLCRVYLSVLSHRDAMGCILAHAFFFGGMFAFIAGSPFVYIELYSVKPESYGLLFAVNIAAMMAMNAINIRLVSRMPLFTLLRFGCLLAVCCAVPLFLLVYFTTVSLWFVVIPVALYVSCIGLTGPNSNTLALHYFPKSAGTANAVAGAIRFGLGALSSSLVGLFHNGTALPMALTMAVCATLSVLSLLLVRNRKEPYTPGQAGEQT